MGSIMQKKKILFMIHDLGPGGAEKVLVSLVNHMDRSRYDITVVSLFGGGVNEQFLASHIHYRTVWEKTIPANSKLMKLLTPHQLHRICVKERFDLEVSYLEGPAARIISGCTDPATKLIGWIHVEQHTKKAASRAFRNYRESCKCYHRFDRIVCVSETVKQDFLQLYPGVENPIVLYNTNETDKIVSLKNEPVENIVFRKEEINLVAVGKITKRKGFDRLARIVKRLRDDDLSVHLYVLGDGPSQTEIEAYLKDNDLQDYYTFLGYQTNPYKFIARCDLFVCASWSEGFSTAATEALIVGTPVCTVDVSGMREMLGNNEFGIITQNDDDSLYQGIKDIICNGKLEHYRKKALERGKSFSTETSVRSVESMFDQLLQRISVN